MDSLGGGDRDRDDIDLSHLNNDNNDVKTKPGRKSKLNYDDGWDFEKLEQELRQHPFFIKELPKEGEPLPPLLEGFQQLKYSTDDNEPEELANNYKEDGLFHFKLKKYRVASMCFTEGIKFASTSKDPETCINLASTLYNNRSAAQFYLENYGSSLKDAKKSFELKPNYLKPMFRAMQCYKKLEKWTELNEMCTTLEKLEPNNSEIKQMRQFSLRKMVECKVDEVKRKKEIQERDQLIVRINALIKDRRIKCLKDDFLQYTYENIEFSSDMRVKLEEDGTLSWPTLICYPQHNQSDFIQAFNEHVTFKEQLVEVLAEESSWDSVKEFKIDNIDVYFMEFGTREYIKVELDQTIGQIMANPRYFLPSNGVPLFITLARNEFSKSLLNGSRDQ